jgi:folate-binding protein YgfZ
VTSGSAIELDGAYRQLREEAGLVRRPSRRVVAVSGPDAVDFLESQLTNDVESLTPGEGAYGALLDRKGHLQSDATLLLLSPDVIWLEAEAEGAERLASHFGMYRVGREVEVDLAELDVLSLIGPGVGRLTAVELHAEHQHREETIAGVDGVRAVATDVGIDLLVSPSETAALIAGLEGLGVPEVDEEAAEIIRVESGVPRLGREMSTDTMPAEAGIVDRAVSFEKGCYIGQETVARLHYRGRPNRRLRGLRLDGPAAPGDSVRLGDREVGEVGTAVLSPAHGPIALAVLRREAEPGQRVVVADAGAAEVIDLPSWPARQD